MVTQGYGPKCHEMEQEEEEAWVQKRVKTRGPNDYPKGHQRKEAGRHSFEGTSSFSQNNP